MEYAIIYGAGTASAIPKGVTLDHYPTLEKALAGLAEYNRLSKKHGDEATEESEDYFSVIRGGVPNTYKVIAV